MWHLAVLATGMSRNCHKSKSLLFLGKMWRNFFMATFATFISGIVLHLLFNPKHFASSTAGVRNYKCVKIVTDSRTLMLDPFS